MSNNTNNQCSNRWHHRSQPQVNVPEERSMFYNKQHNEIFKRRFSFNLNDSQETVEKKETNSSKVYIKK